MPLIRTGICNLFRVPVIARLLFHEGHHGIFNVHQRMLTDGTIRLMYMRETAHTLINHRACETPGRQFIADSGFKPRLDSIEVNVHTSRLSRQHICQ